VIIDSDDGMAVGLVLAYAYGYYIEGDDENKNTYIRQLVIDDSGFCEVS
jgi:hypothetical protein